MRYLAISKDRAVEIPPSTLCVILNPAPRMYLVETETFPHLSEAAILFGSAFHSGNRIERFMNVYRAYECLVKKRSIEFSAIRHSLAHPPKLLGDKATRQALQDMFGSLHIDLNKWQHQKMFFTQLGRLICATDAAIASQVLDNASRLRVLTSWADIVDPSRIGAPVDPEEPDKVRAANGLPRPLQVIRVLDRPVDV